MERAFNALAGVIVSLLCFIAMLASAALIVRTLTLPASFETVAMALVSIGLFALAFASFMFSLRDLDA